MPADSVPSIRYRRDISVLTEDGNMFVRKGNRTIFALQKRWPITKIIRSSTNQKDQTKFDSISRQ